MIVCREVFCHGETNLVNAGLLLVINVVCINLSSKIVFSSKASATHLV